MKKLIILFSLLFSSFGYANDENEISFFSNQAGSNDIGTVDDPDDPNSTPINESAYLLLIVATGTGFIYYRNKSLKAYRY